MPVSFNCEIIDGHCIVHDNDNIILVDTGFPGTIHHQVSFDFVGKKYYPSGVAGLSIIQLRELTGINQITTLLGNDIMRDFKVRFDYRNGSLSFFAHDEESGFEDLPLTIKMGVPVIEAGIHSSRHTFFLDSGARLSYLKKEIATSYEQIGQEEDFYPGLGRFHADVYKVPVEIAGYSFTVKAAIPPDSVLSLLEMNNVDGIIGYDLFRAFIVTINISQGKYSVAWQFFRTSH